MIFIIEKCVNKMIGVKLGSEIQNRIRLLINLFKNMRFVLNKANSSICKNNKR